MAAKGLRAKFEKYLALDVPYFLYPVLSFPEKAVNASRALVGLVSRRRELVVPALILTLGWVLSAPPVFVVPITIAAIVVLLWDWVENDRSGKVRRSHGVKRNVQLAFIRCREDKQKEHVLDALPLYLNHQEYPPRSDPPVKTDDQGEITERPTLLERVKWRWKHRKTKPHTVVVMLGLTPACDDARLKKIAGEVGKYFRATCRFENYRNGTGKLTIRHADVLAKRVPYRPMPMTPQSMFVGINRYGLPVGRGVMDGGGARSWFVFGMRGSGKSAFLNATIANLLRMPHVELYIIDPLGGVDMECWWEFAKDVACTEAQIRRMLNERVQAVTERAAAMAGTVQKIIEPSAEYPMRVLLVDELAILTLNTDAKFRAEAIALLARYNSTGRKTADVLIAATQDPRREIIPGLLQSQFTDRFGFHCGDPIANVTGFGSKLNQLPSGEDVNVAAIPAKHKGRCWVKGGDPVFEEVRTPGLFDHDLEVQVARLAKVLRGSSQSLLTSSDLPLSDLPDISPDPASQASSGPSSSPSGKEGKPRGKGDADKIVYETIVQANGFGAKAAEISAETDVPLRTVNEAINRLRRRGLVDQQLGSRYTARQSA